MFRLVSFCLVVVVLVGFLLRCGLDSCESKVCLAVCDFSRPWRHRGEDLGAPYFKRVESCLLFPSSFLNALSSPRLCGKVPHVTLRSLSSGEPYAYL